MKQTENKRLPDPSLSMDMAAFREQMPWAPVSHGPYQEGAVPPAAQLLDERHVEASFYAPTAQSVTVFIGREDVPLHPGKGGVWTGMVEYPAPGFQPFDFRVDGVPVLNPLAPIGFGGGRPLNYAEVPDPAQDFLELRDVPHGAVTREFYFSAVSGRWESCLVYVPADYQEDWGKRYPVLYLQHGGGENENCWVYQGKVNFIADNLLAEGKMEPCIIVMNNGQGIVEAEGKKKIDYEQFEDVLLRDCVPFVEKKYRTYADAAHRVYAGLSMGSLQGGQIVMHHPEAFCAAGLFTGFLHPQKPPEELEYLSALDDAERFNRHIRVFLRCMGTREPSLPLFEQETRLCREKGIRFEEYHPEGGHEWRVWRQCIWKFLQLIFR